MVVTGPTNKNRFLGTYVFIKSEILLYVPFYPCGYLPPHHLLLPRIELGLTAHKTVVLTTIL